MSRDQKKAKFTEQGKSKSGLYFLVGVVVLAIIAVGGYAVAQKPSDPGQVNVGAVDYSAQAQDFAKVQAAESDGNIVLDLNEIKNKKTTTFDVQGVKFTLANGKAFNYVPLLAYVAPSGDIKVATSLCEPCSGISFHVEGDQLVCNACGTRWTLNELQGVSGGCTQYPPETIKYTIEGDKLVIKKIDLQNWKPRVVS